MQIIVKVLKQELSRNNYFLTVNTAYVPSVYETDSQTYNVTVTFDTSAQPNSYAYLVYNGVVYPTQAIKTTSGSNVIFSSTIDVPTGSAVRQFYFNVYLTPSNLQTTTVTNQTVNTISFVFCSGGVPFINMNYFDETTSNPVNLSVTSSSWNYWLGSGSVAKNYNYNSLLQNTSASFCFSPAYETLFASTNFQYGSKALILLEHSKLQY